MWMAPLPPPQSVVVDSSSSTSAFLHAVEWLGFVCQWVQGVSTFYFPPQVSLKTNVLIPTSKTLARRDLNLNNALRKRKRPPELNWTELNSPFLPSLFAHLIRSYSEAIPKQLVSPPSKNVSGKCEKVSLSEREPSVSQSVSQGISLAFSYLLFTP